MAKTRSKYICSHCGKQSSAFLGRCPNCGQYNTFQEVTEEVKKPAVQERRLMNVPRSVPQRLAEVSQDTGERYTVPMGELNRVLGGGLVPGSITLIGGEPGIGKCVTGDTRVLDPTTGAYRPIREWEDQRRSVLSIDTETLTAAPDEVVAFHAQGVRPVVEVRTRLGRRLTCTPNHPLLTADGWRPVESLTAGACIAAPRELPYFGSDSLSEEEIVQVVDAAFRDEVIPDKLFTATRETFTRFLYHALLWQPPQGYKIIHTDDISVRFDTRSQDFAHLLQHVLLRLGIVAEITQVTESDTIRYFLKSVPTLPASERVYWDEIVSITPAGEAEVYDLSIANHHNFVANDLYIHNSTLLLQSSSMLANSIGTVLYVSGEESASQIKLRADRLALSAHDLYLLTETKLEDIFEQVTRLNPTVLIVDSIQTTYTETIEGSPGLVSQVRECASRLQGLAKSSAVSVFLVGHVTKEGTIAGPRVLEHIVDTVLYLEGDPFQAFRLLRSVKNRFGATSEVGVFEMQGAGMVEVPNPSEAFLAERVVNAPGSAIAVTMEGTRPLLVEIQALTSPTPYGNPRRTPNGVDMNRLLLLSAVLTKRFGLRLAEQDIFVNVVGGMKISEPASDLAMAAAMASSYYDTPLPADMVLIGEVGLSGEVRAVSQLGARLNEAAKIGFKRAVIPKLRRPIDGLPKGMEIIHVRTVGDALKVAVPK